MIDGKIACIYGCVTSRGDDNIVCTYGCVTSRGDNFMTFKPSYGCIPTSYGCIPANEDNFTSEQLARFIEMIVNKDKANGEDE